jgi:hypothetical protein
MDLAREFSGWQSSDDRKDITAPTTYCAVS